MSRPSVVLIYADGRVRIDADVLGHWFITREEGPEPDEYRERYFEVVGFARDDSTLVDGVRMEETKGPSNHGVLVYLERSRRDYLH